jgi:hypothetical protein
MPQEKSDVQDMQSQTEWETPAFARIKKKKTKRVSNDSSNAFVNVLLSKSSNGYFCKFLKSIFWDFQYDNLDKRGSTIFSMELAVANIDKITDCESYLYNTFLDYLCKIVVTIMVIVEVYWKRVLKTRTLKCIL